MNAATISTAAQENIAPIQGKPQRGRRKLIPAFCILLFMRAIPGLLCVTSLSLLTLSGCNRGGLGGNGSATGDSGDQSQKQQSPQKKQNGGQAEPANTEPQNSVSGQPSAASDRGSADAVAHRSVAQPGAPQGTVPDASGKPAPKSRSSPQP
jgi:hypothetical protein